MRLQNFVSRREKKVHSPNERNQIKSTSVAKPKKNEKRRRRRVEVVAFGELDRMGRAPLLASVTIASSLDIFLSPEAIFDRAGLYRG